MPHYNTEQRAQRAVPSPSTSSTSIPLILPAGEAAVTNLLSIYELEEAIYELHYELNNRPRLGSDPGGGYQGKLPGGEHDQRSPPWRLETARPPRAIANPHAVLGCPLFFFFFFFFCFFTVIPRAS